MKKAIVVFTVFLLGCHSTSLLPLEDIRLTQSLAITTEIVTQLSSDEFTGRNPRTADYNLSTDYVEAFLSNNNIAPYFGDSYKDSVTVKGSMSYNIVGLIGEQDPTKSHILIGAHLDHLGATMSNGDNIYNGANDNASGVSAVLQIAKELAKQEYDKNVIVVLFTGEESGLIGSKHLARRLKMENLNLAYMLNFEMIGKTLSSGENQVYLTGFNKSNCAKEMNKIAGHPFAVFLPAAISYRLFSRSDNYPFYEQFNVPCHTLSTFDFENYDHYHKKTDEVEMLDLENMNKVINTSTFIISHLLEHNTALKNS